MWCAVSRLATTEYIYTNLDGNYGKRLEQEVGRERLVEHLVVNRLVQGIVEVSLALLEQQGAWLGEDGAGPNVHPKVAHRLDGDSLGGVEQHADHDPRPQEQAIEQHKRDEDQIAGDELVQRVVLLP